MSKSCKASRRLIGRPCLRFLFLVLMAASSATAARAPARLTATAGGGEIVVAWDRPLERDVVYFLVYRGEGREPDVGAEPFEMVKGTRFVDSQVIAGVEYYYTVVPVERSGARLAPTAAASARAVAASGPRVASVGVEPAGRPVRAGDMLTITVAASSGCRASADVGGLVTDVPLKEKGRTGRYVGTYALKARDQSARRAGYRVVVHLVDASGVVDIAGPEVAVAARGDGRDTKPPVIARASHDGWKVAGFSGKLVAGDVLTVTLEGEAGATGTFEIPGVTQTLPLRETRGGVYSGSYTVRWSDRAGEAPVVARLTDGAGNESKTQAGRPVRFDTRVRLIVTSRAAVLAADGRSETRVAVHAANANGDEVAGHEVAVALAAPDDPAQAPRPAEGGALTVKWGGVTDAFGDVVAQYRAGRVGGTWLAVAKDLTTGDVGVGWLQTATAGQTVAPEAKSARAARTAARRREPRAAGTLSALPGAPSATQLRRAEGSVFVPRFYEGQEHDRVKVSDWLVEPGAEVVKGQALVALETPRGTWRLAAPAAGTFSRRAAAERERVSLGEVVGVVEIDADVWEEEYGK